METTLANLEREQNSDPVIKKVIKWSKTNLAPTANICSVGEEQKYLKQLRRSVTENAIVYKRYFEQEKKMLYQLLCITKAILKEDMYRIHNAPIGAHLQITKTIEVFRKRFHWPEYVEFFEDYNKVCLICLQMQQVQPLRLRTPLPAVLTSESFPAVLMQIDIYAPFPSSP